MATENTTSSQNTSQIQRKNHKFCKYLLSREIRQNISNIMSTKCTKARFPTGNVTNSQLSQIILKSSTYSHWVQYTTPSSVHNLWVQDATPKSNKWQLNSLNDNQVH